jgi:hypothetical protein
VPDRRALIIGIDEYDSVSGLSGCVADANAMAEVLYANDDGSANFDTQVFTSPGSSDRITRGFLRTKWNDLFAAFDGDVLFYFAGHGAPTAAGGFLVTQDGTEGDLGLAMDELLVLANRSRAHSVLLILDCCFSGLLGNPAALQGDSLENTAVLREGVTIVAASRPDQPSNEIGGYGVFTDLLVGALKGGAADVRGRVSAAAMYAYAEAALGAWDQRPMYKSHAKRLDPVRMCRPAVTDELLREIPLLFPEREHRFQIDLSFEHTEPAARAENVAVFDKFKILRNAGLLRTVSGDDLYFCALRSGSVYLTPLGQFYWQLAAGNRL